MSLAKDYFNTVRNQVDLIGASQMKGIERAGDLFGQVLCRGQWIYLFGTGHSHMIAEELFYRAGGLARVRPILYSPLMLHESATESTLVERDPSVVDDLLKAYPLAKGDVLLIASNSGRNPVPVELAIRARDLGVSVVGLINRQHSDAFESRHASGKKLADLADVVIDNCGVVGDACVALPGEGLSTGAASTVTGALIVQMIACHAIESAMAKGWQPEVYCSSNAGRAAHNDGLIERYRSSVKHL
jgi:uncharacterized phosphosugar-binding protein